MQSAPTTRYRSVATITVPKKEGDWALTVHSVIVFGRIRIVEDQEKTNDISRRLCYKFTDDEDYIAQEIQRSGPGTLLMELIPEHMTGKLINEK